MRVVIARIATDQALRQSRSIQIELLKKYHGRDCFHGLIIVNILEHAVICGIYFYQVTN